MSKARWIKMVCSAAEGKDSFIIAAADKKVVRWRMTSDEPLPVTINVMWNGYRSCHLSQFQAMQMKSNDNDHEMHLMCSLHTSRA